MNKNCRRLGTFAALAVAALTIGGCSSVRETFGVAKRSPDEFQVVRRQPLVVPPDRNLRPPRPGEQSIQQSGGDARGLIVGGERPATPASGSAAERALVAAVPVRSEPDIRRLLLSDNQQVAVLDQRTFLWILDWQKPKPTAATGAPLDAAAEAQRLRQEGVVTTTRVGGP